MAYITGQRAFWTIDLEVGPGALVPRPDSETLIAAATEHFGGTSGPTRVLDLGTGPGTLLLAALDEWPKATGIGIDASEAALAYARRNAGRLGMQGRAEFRLGDWAKGIDERFDLILCNPPYVAAGAETGPGVADYEPAEALFAGPEGLDDYRRLAPEIGRLLAPGGLAAIEIGVDQAESAVRAVRGGGPFALGRGRPRRPAPRPAYQGLSRKGLEFASTIITSVSRDGAAPTKMMRPRHRPPTTSPRSRRCV